MTYFMDLSPYEYSKGLNPSSAGLWNIGWLDAKVTYPKGAVDTELTAKLLALCKRPVYQYRGWHHCHFCSEYPVRLMDFDGEFCFGDGEIRVPGKQGKVYAAPNLIYHYVVAHEYRPPDEFLEALRDMNPAKPHRL